MPYYGSGNFWEQDPQRWEQCKRKAALQMVAEGWNEHARKFDEVKRRRAMRIWAADR